MSDVDEMFAPARLMDGLKLTGFEDVHTKRLLTADHLLRKAKMASIKPLLPLLLNLKGKPYTLDDYFPFEPFFRTRVPRKTVLMTGRQVSKSTSLAAKSIVQSNCIPYFSTLFITPLFEMIRRFSQNYVRPFIETSPVRRLFTGTSTINSVLQRTFKNRSQMVFSFAYLDAERTRGISADQIVIDEVQNLNIDFIPIIRETMSGSKWGGLESYAGTPLTLDNCLESLFQDSSQAEWVIKCHNGICGHYNVPTLTHDLDRMIGPYRSDISRDRPGVVCAKCSRPILPATGRWIHAYPERRWTFAGYHVPQIVMPMHYGNAEKWGLLVGKKSGKGSTSAPVFYNEVCGQSYDTGARIITVTELKAAAVLPHKNTLEEAIKNLSAYRYRVVAADWGGGGADKTSYTNIAAMGMLPNGKIDVLWGLKSLTPHEHIREAKLCLGAMRHFKALKFGHDYTGAGTLRETFMVQAGLPLDTIIPFYYQRAASGNIINYHEPTDAHPRGYWITDKSRSLLTTTNAIKCGMLRFFQDDYENADNPGLLRDFLALVEEKSDSRTGRDIYTIIRDPNLSDDFAQAVNMGCLALWHLSGQWPNFAEIERYKVTSDLIQAVHPAGTVDWEDIDQ